MGHSKQGEFLGHPKGLYILFFTEMWERFSYYGMRALLLLYLVDFFKFTQADASRTYKWYVALVYLTPLLGGFLADRLLGNKWAIIIGAIMMSIGHFLMAIDDIWMFYVALGFLIMGNGFFKPNMSVQVGQLYPQNDPRRDGAYTIFYMGINIGAFLSPLICGALKETPGLGYHWGFGAAGVGMLFGLLVYLFGLPWVKELPESAVYESPEEEQTSKDDEADHTMTEDEARDTPSVVPSFSKLSPSVFIMLGIVLMIGSPLLHYGLDLIDFDNFLIIELAAGAAFFASWILSHLTMAVRDRVLAIYALFVFVVFFWSAFEQAGNAMNVWADQTTNRYVTGTQPTAEVLPKAFVDIAEQGFWETFKVSAGKVYATAPVNTASFQSINAAAIVLFAPMFAWLWVFLARRKIKLSFAGKMAIGVFFQGVAFSLMVWSVTYENGTSTSSLAALPNGVVTEASGVVHFYDAPEYGDDKAFERFNEGKPDEKKDKMIAHGGRLTFDSTSDKMTMNGVFNNNHRDRILRATAPHDFIKAVWDMTKQSDEAKKASDERGDKKFSFEIALPNLPKGFDPDYLRGYDPDKLRFDKSSQKFIIGIALADKDYKQIIVAGSDPAFRTALNDLYVQSAEFRVSSWWLVWFYVLCTIGELCLSPVGLSMVSKLAPRRFATMLMGIWLLTSFFGNFIAGFAGENWELLKPGEYFTYITLALFAASFVCFLLIKTITAMMHGVR